MGLYRNELFSKTLRRANYLRRVLGSNSPPAAVSKRLTKGPTNELTVGPSHAAIRGYLRGKYNHDSAVLAAHTEIESAMTFEDCATAVRKSFSLSNPSPQTIELCAQNLVRHHLSSLLLQCSFPEAKQRISEELGLGDFEGEEGRWAISNEEVDLYLRARARYELHTLKRTLCIDRGVATYGAHGVLVKELLRFMKQRQVEPPLGALCNLLLLDIGRYGVDSILGVWKQFSRNLWVLPVEAAERAMAIYVSRGENAKYYWDAALQLYGESMAHGQEMSLALHAQAFFALANAPLTLSWRRSLKVWSQIPTEEIKGSGGVVLLEASMRLFYHLGRWELALAALSASDLTHSSFRQLLPTPTTLATAAVVCMKIHRTNQGRELVQLMHAQHGSWEHVSEEVQREALRVPTIAWELIESLFCEPLRQPFGVARMALFALRDHTENESQRWFWALRIFQSLDGAAPMSHHNIEQRWEIIYFTMCSILLHHQWALRKLNKHVKQHVGPAMHGIFIAALLRAHLHYNEKMGWAKAVEIYTSVRERIGMNLPPLRHAVGRRLAVHVARGSLEWAHGLRLIHQLREPLDEVDYEVTASMLSHGGEQQKSLVLLAVALSSSASPEAIQLDLLPVRQFLARAHRMSDDDVDQLLDSSRPALRAAALEDATLKAKATARRVAPSEASDTDVFV